MTHQCQVLLRLSIKIIHLRNYIEDAEKGAKMIPLGFNKTNKQIQHPLFPRFFQGLGVFRPRSRSPGRHFCPSSMNGSDSIFLAGSPGRSDDSDDGPGRSVPFHSAETLVYYGKLVNLE